MSYSIAAAREILAETRRICAKDTRCQPNIGSARAAATTSPPAEKYTFADEILKHQEEDDSRTLPEATRLAANARPDLQKAFVKEKNEERAEEDRLAKETARRRHRNR